MRHPFKLLAGDLSNLQSELYYRPTNKEHDCFEMYEITLITASRGKYGIKAGQVNINHKLFVDQALATIGMNYSEVLWKNGADSYKIIIEALWNNNYRVLIADIAGNNLKTLKKSTFVAFGPLNY